jgi:hypothetical protein
LVLTARPTAPTPTLIVPDEQTWTMSGSDPLGDGLRPVFAPGEAGRVLLPERLPAPLREALESVLAVLPQDVEVETRVLPGLDGRPVASLFAREGAGAAAAHPAAHGYHDAQVDHEMHGAGQDVQGQHEGKHAGHHDTDGGHHDTHVGHHDMHVGHHEMDGGHEDMDGGHHEMHGGHHDMMAIVGEPSADGLVMEPIELRFGPLGTPLPGGLAVNVTLDGDVVADASVEALLGADASADGRPSPPDLLTPVAWTLLIEAAAEGRASTSGWRWLAALEAERAVSHLAWLRSLGRLLGWPVLIDRSTRALEPLPALVHGVAGRARLRRDGDRATQSALERAAAAADLVSALVAKSRLLRMRAGGLGTVSGEQAWHARLRGPAARASGLRDDARADDPFYTRLGFAPVLHTGGDAHARALVRVQEAANSLRLAAAALRADADGIDVAAPFPAPGKELEGPRGPLRAQHGAAGWQLRAPGSKEALVMAGEAMVGAEWSAALVALASFDLSPWRIGA